MKTVQLFFTFRKLLLLAAMSMSTLVFAQETKEDKQAAQKVAFENMINSKQYIFVPSTVSPASGRTRQVTSYYDVKVNGDSLISVIVAKLSTTENEI